MEIGMLGIVTIAVAVVSVLSTQDVNPLLDVHGEFRISNNSSTSICVPAGVVLPGLVVGGLDLQDAHGHMHSFYLSGETTGADGAIWVVIAPGGRISFAKRIVLQASELEATSILRGRLHYAAIPCDRLVERDFEMTADLDRYVSEGITAWSELR
jgi:hypothetical protein